MTQKLLKVGDSAAVTIPKKAMEELGLKIGDDINVKVDLKKRVVLVQPNKQLSEKDKRIAELTLNFINRYRKDLENLAKK